MENVYSQIDVNAYVAKYMDETGCSFSEACEELELILQMYLYQIIMMKMSYNKVE